MPSAVGAIGISSDRVDSAQKHALGAEMDFNDGTRRKYVRAGAAITQYDALTVDFAEGPYDWQATTGVGTPCVGVCPVSGVSDNYFFWAIIRGYATVKSIAAVVAGTPLVPSATAGALDDIAATAANAMTAAQGVGVTAVTPDSPSSGFARVVLS